MVVFVFFFLTGIHCLSRWSYQRPDQHRIGLGMRASISGALETKHDILGHCQLFRGLSQFRSQVSVKHSVMLALRLLQFLLLHHLRMGRLDFRPRFYWILPYFDPDFPRAAYTSRPSWCSRSIVTFLNLSHCMLLHVRLRFLIAFIQILLPSELVEHGFICVQKILVTGSQTLDYLSKDAPPVLVNQTRYHLVSHVFSRGFEHLLQLSRRETLYDNILLLLFQLILSFEVLQSRPCQWLWLACGCVYTHLLRVLLLENALKQSLPSFLHLNQPWLKPLPQLVVFGSSHVWRVPNVMLDELLDLVLPLRPQHVFFHTLHRYHQPTHILYQHVIACYQQLLLLFRGHFTQAYGAGRLRLHLRWIVAAQ